MFKGWENFYFMLGSAGAGLIGLLFVVVTLTSGIERSRALRGTALYMTPTAFHFAIVLVASAVAIAPGFGPAITGALIGLAALTGLFHGGRATVGIRVGLPGGEPAHWSDAWFYGAVPSALYVGLLADAVGLWRQAAWAAPAMAALLMALLLAAIRNAWDLVTWIAPGLPGTQSERPTGGDGPT